MQTHELSPLQLRQLGIEALVQALGVLGMARFLQQFDRGSGDYAHDRTTVLAGITLEAAILQGRGNAFLECRRLYAPNQASPRVKRQKITA